MKRLIGLASGLLIVGMAAICSADTISSATSRVHVKVNPDVAVSLVTPTVDLGEIQRGLINGRVDFRVDANQQYVQLSVAASNLYKGDHPLYAGPDAGAPILVVPTASIQPENGSNPATGQSTVSVALLNGTTIGNFPASESDPVVFESAANGHFSQVVHTSFAWNQDQVEKPAGDYSGVVRLTAALLP